VSSFQAHRQARIGDGRAFAAAWRAGPAIGPDRAGSATRVEAIVTALASRRRRCEPHLNRVLGKTGVLCQTELAALLAGAALELYRSRTHYRRLCRLGAENTINTRGFAWRTPIWGVHCRLIMGYDGI
jgi:hypothetical protein